MPAPEASTTTPAATHQCGRCRATFALEPGDDPQAVEWWACPPCRAILLPDRR